MKTVKVSLNRAKKPVLPAEEVLNTKEPSAFKIEEIYLPLNHLFNPAAKKAFEHSVNKLVVERDLKFVSTTQTKVFDQVRYFGAQAVGERKIFDAAQKVANQVNAYADRGYVTGVMLKLAMMKLVNEPHQLERWLILSYVALSPEGIDYMQKNPTKVEFKEGGVPLNSDDL